jgi:hypothetical protein
MRYGQNADNGDILPPVLRSSYSKKQYAKNTAEGHSQYPELDTIDRKQAF